MRDAYVVELFSGTKSVSEALRALYEPNHKVHVFSLDLLKKFQPTRAANILEWDFVKDLTEFLAPMQRWNDDRLFVHASPPCTEYSVAKSSGVRKLEHADRIVTRTLKIISWLAPDIWSLENPRGLLRTRPCMAQLEQLLKECSYCRYGFPYRKHTDIWTNSNALLKKCTKKTPCDAKRQHNRHLYTAQCRPCGESLPTSREDSYRLPAALIQDIYSAK